MTLRFPIYGWLTVIAVGSVAGLASASAPTESDLKWFVVPGSRLWLEGDSTLHKYHAEARRFDTTFSLRHSEARASQPNGLLNVAKEGRVTGVKVTIPVVSLSSGNEGLDKNMREALKSRVNPLIVFEMKSFEIVPAENMKNSSTVRMKGSLTVAGVEKQTDIEARAVPVGQYLYVTGTKAVSMKDFGVKAPVLMLGTIRTADQVAIKFDIRIGVRGVM